MTRHLLVIATLAACTGKQLQAVSPEISSSVAAGDLIALGRGISVATSWSATCDAGWLDKTLEDRPDDLPTQTCSGKAYRLDVVCSSACQVRDGETDAYLAGGSAATSTSAHTGAAISVVPLKPGPFHFEVTIQRNDTGETRHYRSPDLVVRTADAVGLLCYYPTELQGLGDREAPQYLEICDARPLTSKQPFVLPIAEFSGKRYSMPTAALNGIDHLSGRTLRLIPEYRDVRSLADVFPRAVGRDGLAPGTYQVVVSAGDASSTLTLRVAP